MVIQCLKNWDGEGASEPQKFSIEKTIAFLTLINPKISPPEPMLFSSGRSGLYWNTGSLYSSLNILRLGLKSLG